MVVSTRRSSFSVPPLPAPHTYETASGNTQPAFDRKKVRTANAHCPPRPPTSRKLQRTVSTPLTANATPSSASLQNSPIPTASRDMERMILESPSESAVLTSGHFLQGINVEKCVDVLSIPDPPTPKTAEKLQRKRRQSSPFILDPLKFKENDQVVSIRSSKSRKSLGHLPFLHDSPDWTLPRDTRSEWQNAMESGEYGNHALRNVTNESVDKNTPINDLGMASLTTPIAPPSCDHSLKLPPTIAPMSNEKDEGAQSTDNEKPGKLPTKKRRESIVFPVDLFINETTTSQHRHETTNDSHHVQHESNAPQAHPMLDSEPPTFDWDQIGNLIRQYISLSPSSRITSAQAASIQAMTGYPLIPPSQRTDPTVTADLNWSSSTQNPKRDILQVDSERRLHFMKYVAPNMQKLEKMKEQEDKEVEARTNTRVQKVKFKYHYYDISTGRRIASEQYKHRYMAMLEENEAREDTKAQAWLADLPACQVSALDRRMNIDETDQRESSEKLPVEGSGEDLRLCATELAWTTSPEPERLSTDEKGSTEPAPMASPIRLPLPDIDEESSDPDIAEVERKLWAAIDAALEEYSIEVIAILKAKGKPYPTDLAEF